MNRNRLIVVAAVALVALGIGVAVVATDGSGTSRAGATTTPTAVSDIVSVSGTGSVEGVPDTLVATLRVHVSNLASVQEAINTSSIDAHKVINSLRSNGLAAADIKTADISLNQHYDNHGTVTGYDSGETLTVHIHPLSKVGQILTAATTAAGNSVSLNGLSYDIADNTKLLAAARAAAFNNAKAAASQYATLGGTSLDHVVSIKAQVHNASPIYKGTLAQDSFAAGSAGAPRALPIRAGQKKVSVTVQVVWALH